MNIEDLRTYCLSKKGATESFPFDESTLVFKVMDKMFALTDLDSPLSVNLKCDPEKAIVLREQFIDVVPGYHMSKKHWNTIFINGSIRWELITQWIDQSYELVVNSLPKAKRDQLIKQ